MLDFSQLILYRFKYIYLQDYLKDSLEYLLRKKPRWKEENGVRDCNK